HTVVTGRTGVSRLELDARLGPGASLVAEGLVLAGGVAMVDQHLRIAHAGAGARSTQRFRHVLDDRARAVFTGEVDVEPGVAASDAQQSVQTLLLADGASIVNRPWLRIRHDDVRASHGATVGRIDPEALFYLRS